MFSVCICVYTSRRDGEVGGMEEEPEPKKDAIL